MSLLSSVWERSNFARAHPATTKQVVEIAEQLEWIDGTKPDEMRQRIIDEYQRRYGTSIWVILAVRFIVPVVVELLWKWLESRNKK